MPFIDQTIIQARVTLQDIEPPIWRRLLPPPALNLAELHHVLQAAFGWCDEHLHQFIIGGLVYGAPELAEDTASEDDPRTFEATDVHLRDFDLFHSSSSNSGSPRTSPSNTRPASTAPATDHPRTSADPRVTFHSSKPGAIPLTKSTRPCVNGPAAPFIPRHSISRPPTKPSRPPVAEPAVTTSSVADKPPQPVTAIVAHRPQKLSLHTMTGPRWHLDEMMVRIGGEWMYLWTAVAEEGEILDVLVQRRRDKRGALKLMRKLLKKQGFAPTKITTDKLRSYGAAFSELG